MTPADGSWKKTVTVLYVHGINVDQADYANKLQAGVVRNVRRLTRNQPPRIVSRSVCWWDVFAPAAHHLRLTVDHRPFGWKALRDVVLTTAAQAVGYEDEPGHGSYEQVHRRIDLALAELAREAPGAPLLIVAHSLGTVVASNYIWDHHARLRNLRGLVTMGSPLALYAGRYPGGGKAIDLRGDPWVNLLYPSDILGWPLRDLNESYRQQVTEDILLNPGWFSGKTPASHTHYWGSSEVAAIVGDMVFKLWDDMEGW